MLNKINIAGRLTADAEMRQTTTGKSVASFTVAVDRDFKGPNDERETDFINCVAWQGTAEFISKYFSKGSMAIIVGRLQTRKYETSDGQKRTATEVIVENIYFGGAKTDNTNNTTTPSVPAGDIDGFVPVEDADLPF